MAEISEGSRDVVRQNRQSVHSVGDGPGTPKKIITGTVMTDPPPAITLMARHAGNDKHRDFPDAKSMKTACGVCIVTNSSAAVG